MLPKEDKRGRKREREREREREKCFQEEKQVGESLERVVAFLQGWRRSRDREKFN